jgi:hypothetical protein
MTAEEAYRFAKRIEALELTYFPRKETALRSIAIAIMPLSNAEIGILIEILKHAPQPSWEWWRFQRAIETRPLTKGRAYAAYVGAEIFDNRTSQFVPLTEKIASAGAEWEGL